MNHKDYSEVLAKRRQAKSLEGLPPSENKERLKELVSLSDRIGGYSRGKFGQLLAA